MQISVTDHADFGHQKIFRKLTYYVKECGKIVFHGIYRRMKLKASLDIENEI